MTIRSGIAGLLLILALCSISLMPLAVAAQETAPPTTEKAEDESAALPEFGGTKVWGELGKIFGKQFSLTTDPEKGRLTYELGDPEGLKYFQAKETVHIISDMFEIRCNKIEYTGKDKVAVATGSPVWIKQAGITATCGRFLYDTQKKRSELSESPAIFNKDESGKVIKTIGKKIYFQQDDKGNVSVMVEGNAQFIAEGSTPQAGDDQPAAPVRIDEKDVDKIK